jgi:transposase
MASNDPQSALVRAALLEEANAALRADLARRDELLVQREQRIKQLEEALRVLKADRWGASREKLGEAPGQCGLFNEVEALVELAEALGAVPELAATPLRETKPLKGEPGRKALAGHLPRIEIRHELPESERTCACGTPLTEIAPEVSEQIDYVPAKVQVLRHLRAKYVCPGCEQCVKTAPVVPQLLPKTNAAPGLLAHLVTAKYVDSLPLHRQERIFARHGMHLPRATQAAWMIGLFTPLTPLLNLMDERIRGSGYVRIDETPVQVLKSERASSTEHWMWVRVAGPPGRRLILFDYDASRGSAVAERLLEGCEGYVQSDGYGAYDGVAARLALTHVGCMAHARRRFFEAIKALPRAQQTSATAAHEAVRRIDALYTIERETKALDADERQRVRQQLAVPQLASLHAWAETLVRQTLPSGKLGEALGYLLAQWPKLVRYVEDPRLAIDTNLAENAIRPFALGRRNWLFADTAKGARASAALYSLTSTAKANGLEPYAYLRQLFTELPKASTVTDIEALLPFAHPMLPE